jgi:signal peptidase II
MPLWLLLVAGLLVILDQITKMLVTRRFPEGKSVGVTSWMRIRPVVNARRLPLLHNPRVSLPILAAVCCSIFLIVQQGYFFQHHAAQLGLGLALGGAFSNVYDQLFRGAVMDFLDLGWWPVFNLADVAITIGVTLALWFFL